MCFSGCKDGGFISIHLKFEYCNILIKIVTMS